MNQIILSRTDKLIRELISAAKMLASHKEIYSHAFKFHSQNKPGGERADFIEQTKKHCLELLDFAERQLKNVSEEEMAGIYQDDINMTRELLPGALDQFYKD